MSIEERINLQIEVFVQFRSEHEASSIITSITRHTNTSTNTNTNTNTSTSTSNTQPIVTYESFLTKKKQLNVFLQIKEAITSTTRNTTMDTTTSTMKKGCGHCEGLFGWCQQHSICSKIAICITREISLFQNDMNFLLTQSSLGTKLSFSTLFRTCFDSEIPINLIHETNIIQNTSFSKEFEALMIFSSAIRCQIQRFCPFRIDSNLNRMLVWQSIEGKQVIEIHQLHLIPLNQSIQFTLKIRKRSLCTLSITNTTTFDEMEQKMLSECTYATHFGQIRIQRNTTINTFNDELNQIDVFEITYKNLIGSLPEIEIGVLPIEILSATSRIEQLPGIELLVEAQDFATRLPPLSQNSTTEGNNTDEKCQKCHQMMLHECMRNAGCLAYQDCILRDQNTANALYTFFKNPNPDLSTPNPDPSTSNPSPIPSPPTPAPSAGKTFSLTNQILKCHSESDVTTRGWRQLVDASACYAFYQCPIEFQQLFPNVTVKWHVPDKKQLLRLEILSSDTNISNTLINLPMMSSDGQIVRQKTLKGDVFLTSPIGEQQMMSTLKWLLSFENILIEKTKEEIQVDTLTKIYEWMITYGNWAGKVPNFLAVNSDVNTLTKWTLSSFPQQDMYIEIV
jgi:hypothetical protein